MSFLRKIPAVFLILLLGAGLFGCAQADNQQGKEKPVQPGKTGQVGQSDKTAEDNMALRKLLPEKEGFRWVYNGFAEYGHQMDLERIVEKDGQITYYITGEVADMSGGASDRDFSLSVEYVIKDGILTQKKKEELMMDSISDKLQLLKTPLQKNAKWKQTVIDKDGNKHDLDCSIEDITGINGVKEYTVLYQDNQSDYFEKRRIREGIGVVSLEKMFTTGEESFIAGYALYEEASGYRE